MATNRKRANQQNAAQSTGPISPAGKTVIRQNALKHGLRAQQVVVLGEKAADFEALRNSLIELLKPADALQEALVDRIAVSLWRLRRIPALEAGIFQYQSLANKLRDVDSKIHEEIARAEREIFPPIADPQRNVPPQLVRRRKNLQNQMNKESSRFGRVFCQDVGTHDALGKLSRYESQISRELFRALSQLERLQTISLLPEIETQQTD